MLVAAIDRHNYCCNVAATIATRCAQTAAKAAAVSRRSAVAPSGESAYIYHIMPNLVMLRNVEK